LSPITFILGSILLLPYPNVLGAVAPAYFILGLGYGSTNVTLAAYVGEIATKGQRGTLCAMKQFFFFIGVLIYAAICRFQHRPTSLADETVDFHRIADPHLLCGQRVTRVFAGPQCAHRELCDFYAIAKFVRRNGGGEE
jgi:Sugar (and other) transporter